MFVEGTKTRRDRVTFGWYLIWFLATVLLVLFIVEPTWFVLPPWIK